MPTGRLRDAVENTEAARQSAVVVEQGCGATVVESLLENGDNKLWLEASGWEDTNVGPLVWCRGSRTGTSGRSDVLILAFLIVDIVLWYMYNLKKVFLL